MWFKRIKLENWRGVGSAEIEFDSGITIVEGENEAGKSSFIEALNLLFRERDSTKKQLLKRVAPKGVDAGSRVELELIAGNYHLTYSKTFNKKSETTLFIHKPQQDQLVGVEAHERVLQILDETIDFDLWQAIQLEQGEEFNQVNLKESDSLARALDSAAGGVGAGDGESVLLEKAKQEYLKYFTEKTGKATGELATLRQEQINLEANGRDLNDSLNALDHFISESASVESQLRSMQQGMPQMRLSLADYEKKRERERLRQEIGELETQLKKAESNDVELRQLHKAIASRLKATQQERDDLLVTKAEVDTRLRSAEALVHLDERRTELTQLERQLNQLKASHAGVAELEKEFANFAIDERKINRIEKLEQDRRELKIHMDSQSAKIQLRFLKSVVVDDDEEQRYNKGETLTLDSLHAIKLRVADALTIKIDPATDGYELIERIDKTTTELNTLLHECGVESVVEAIALYKQRSILKARLQELRRGFKKQEKEQSLVGLTELVKKKKTALEDLYLSITEKVDKENIANCKKALWKESQELESGISKVRVSLDKLHQDTTQANIAADVHSQSLETDRKTLSLLKNKLVKLSSKCRDSVLEQRYLDSVRKLNVANESRRQLASNADYVDAELLADNAVTAFRRAQSEMHELELRQADLKARLDQLQSEGLHEKHQTVLAEQDDKTQRLRQLDRKANAAALLWGTLKRQQTQAQLSYAKPLAARVISLGKVVFGDDFAVTIDEDLSIVSRTLKGRTLPFSELSGGAREQLAILLRLAAVQLVSDEESMPLILDDTLGHTDARRLEIMGAVISGASKTSQIVIMTCYPIRYRYVGEAKVVKLKQSNPLLE